MEAIKLVELNVPLAWVDVVNIVNIELNSQLAKEELDFLKEWRWNALLWLKNYQKRALLHNNSTVRPRRFVVGALVLRKMFQNNQELNTSKLGLNYDLNTSKLRLNWERLYIMVE